MLIFGSGGYSSGSTPTIGESVLLDKTSNSYFSKAAPAVGNTTWTMSMWVKRGRIGLHQELFGNLVGGPGYHYAYFGGGDDLNFVQDGSGSSNGLFYSKALFRDTAAWYHLVFVFDPTNATPFDRMRLYVNGVRLTEYTSLTNVYANYSYFNNASYQIGVGAGYTTSNPFKGYMADVNFVSGLALDPSYFGVSYNGSWKPITYSGSYGANGFRLEFANSSNLGLDTSGQGNNLTPVNLSSTDQTVDAPEKNYSTLNVLSRSSSVTVTQGNLYATAPAGNNWIGSTAKIPPSGKYYGEIKAISATHASSAIELSFIKTYMHKTVNYVGGASGSGVYGFYASNAGTLVLDGNVLSWTLSTIAANEILQFACDASTGKIWIGRNNAWYDSSGGTTGNPATGVNPMATIDLSDYEIGVLLYGNTVQANYGQRAFTYTPPSGFSALSAENLATPDIANPGDYFNVEAYSGNDGTNQRIIGFQPDMVWGKSRTSASNNRLVDSVRGGTYKLSTDSNSPENTDVAPITFNANGYTMTGSNHNNSSLQNYVGWCWKKGATPGFDIQTYTGTGAIHTIPHSLGIAPSMYFTCLRNYSSSVFALYHKMAGTGGFRLNTNGAYLPAPAWWNGTHPTSTSFTVGIDTETNFSGYSFVAYLWSEIEGFSKFGLYYGNGLADGPFVHCGFRPAYVLVKSSTYDPSEWVILDTARSTYNVADYKLCPNVAVTENNASYGGGTGVNSIDILSNGFKPKTGNVATNVSGHTYIYAAFAESPFKYALAR